MPGGSGAGSGVGSGGSRKETSVRGGDGGDSGKGESSSSGVGSRGKLMERGVGYVGRQKEHPRRPVFPSDRG